jgi:hypothetical protein
VSVDSFCIDCDCELSQSDTAVGMVPAASIVKYLSPKKKLKTHQRLLRTPYAKNAKNVAKTRLWRPLPALANWLAAGTLERGGTWR